MLVTMLSIAPERHVHVPSGGEQLPGWGVVTVVCQPPNWFEQGGLNKDRWQVPVPWYGMVWYGMV